MTKILLLSAAVLLVTGCLIPARADDAAASDGSAGSETVVNGASASDFLGSGSLINRDKMDATLDREYNKYVRLDPLKPGEQPPSVNPSVENAELAATRKASKKQRKGFKGFVKGIGHLFTDAAGVLGFPVGPQDDDARTDKFDNM